MPTPDRRRDRRASVARRRLGVRLQRVVANLAVAVFASGLTSAASTGTTVMLPIEIVGQNGTMSSVVVDVPAQHAREVRSLWMQIHGLSFPDMAGVQINNSVWFSLNN